MDSEGGDHGAGRYDLSQDRRSVRTLTMFGRSPSKAIKVEVFAKTDLGRTRDHNEDHFLVADLTRRDASLKPAVRIHEIGERGSLFVVADGMGGAAAGEVASEMATETIYEQMVNAWGSERELTPQRFAYRLREAVETANRQIHSYAGAHPELRGMGTTTTAVGILGDRFFLSQVGDSRAYLIRQGQAVQLTKDQSLMQRLVEAGELTEEEAAKSERRNIILQALEPDLQAACDRLIGLANERGGPDNITVILARFDGEGLRPPEPSAEVGHQVYPLIDTETSTEPVPVYKGSRPPEPTARARWRLVALALAALAAAAALYLVKRSP